MSVPAPVSVREPIAAPASRPVILFCALAGAVLAQILLARLFGSQPGAARDSWRVALSLFGLLTVSGGLVVWAIWSARDQTPQRSMGAVIAAAGILMRLPYFGAGPMLEDDHYRYLLDGAMLAQGFNPYALAPATLLGGTSPALAPLVEAGRDAISAINFPDLRSVYPGTAQALFVVAHWILPWKIDGLRLVIFAAEALTAILIWDWLRRTGGATIRVALYWCNPLMAFCLTGQAHIDAALAPAILLALLAASQNRATAAGIWLGLAVGVKLWPLLLAPLLARKIWPDRRNLRAFSLGVGGITLVTCGPLLWASLSAHAGLTAYAGGWSINNAPFAWLSFLFFQAIGPGSGELVLRAAIVGLAAGASLYMAFRTATGPPGLLASASALAGLLFYLSPAQFPWYAAWFLPLAAASGSWVLIVGAVGLPVYFLFFPLAAVGLRDMHSYGLAACHLVPLAGAFLLRHRVNAREVAP